MGNPMALYLAEHSLLSRSIAPYLAGVPMGWGNGSLFGRAHLFDLAHYLAREALRDEPTALYLP